MQRGEEVHGEAIEGADASGGVAFKLFNAAQTTERSLDADEYLTITDISANMGDTGLVAADSAANGKRAAFLASGINNINFETPYDCPKGVTPKVFADTAASAKATIQGYISKV